MDNVSGTAKPWLKYLKEAEDREYHETCDKVDELYSGLRKLTANRRDRQYQIFYANLEVKKPSLYSRPPVAVVSSRFKDRKPLPRRAADILERALNADIENDKLHDAMLLIRDDLAVNARGVPWLRLVERDGIEVPSSVHVDRRDFRTDCARYWHEVGWVAKQAWLTRGEVKQRFGEVPEGMVFEEKKPEKKGADSKYEGPAKASIWEIWHRPSRKVVFVSEGVQDVIEEADPPLDLTDFFPCPRPAYGTLQRGTLTPVPDFVFYRDQVEEIHELTARIGGLQQALRVKGFYASGNAEVGDAIESAMKRADNNALLVPISSMAALGTGRMDDAIAWWPIEQVITTLQACIEVRRQLIQDVYEITGISDIMRGSTDANETLGAQELKSQYGSIRIREQQGELVRVARDIIRMKAEIMCENVPIDDLLLMAQVDDLPRQAEIEQQVQQITAQAWQAVQQMDPNDPATQQMIEQQKPQIEAQIAELQQQVTVEQVEALLKDQKLRPFVLDIETDSTIQPDENAEKQKRVEFMQALAPLLQQGVGAMQQAPQLGKFVAESIRFVASGFRAGRRMDDEIDDLAEGFANYQPPPQGNTGEDPEAAKAQAEAAMVKAQADAKKAEVEGQIAQAELPLKQQEGQLKAQETSAKIELTQAQTQKVLAEIGKVQRETELAGVEAQMDAKMAQADLALKARGQQQAEAESERSAQMQEREFQRAGQQAKVADKRADAESAAKVKSMNRKPTNG